MPESTATRMLMRTVRVGEVLSFDGGRIVVQLQDKTGRRACLRMSLREDVRVDKGVEKQQQPTPIAIEK